MTSTKLRDLIFKKSCEGIEKRSKRVRALIKSLGAPLSLKKQKQLTSEVSI